MFERFLANCSIIIGKMHLLIPKETKSTTFQMCSFHGKHGTGTQNYAFLIITEAKFGVSDTKGITLYFLNLFSNEKNKSVCSTKPAAKLKIYVCCSQVGVSMWDNKILY